jgi:hypothetical protein
MLQGTHLGGPPQKFRVFNRFKEAVCATSFSSATPKMIACVSATSPDRRRHCSPCTFVQVSISTGRYLFVHPPIDLAATFNAAEGSN